MPRLTISFKDDKINIIIILRIKIWNHSTLQIFIRWPTRKASPGSKTAGRAQSNITTRIQQLEEELAVELSSAATKKMVLSPAGVQFLSYARRILSPAEEGKAGSASDHTRRQPAAGRDGGDRRQPSAAAAYPLPTAMPAGGCHPQHPADPPVNRGGITAALDAALVCLPPGTDGQPACPPGLDLSRCFRKP